MKKNLVLLLIVLLPCGKLFSQEFLEFSKVIRIDSVDKQMLFVAIYDWFATTYNSANDVIQMADKDAGIIIGNGNFKYVFENGNKLSYICYAGSIGHTIKVYIKDERFKVELTSFKHRGNPSSDSSCTLGMITTDEIYKTSGLGKNMLNKVWKDLKIKAEKFSKKIFISLEKKTSNFELEFDSDDW